MANSPHNQANKKALLLAAWGASTAQGRSGLIQFEHKCRMRFSLPVRWAYTSQLLRDRLTLQRQKSDSVFKALRRLRYEGCQGVAIQPLQTIAGREYEAVSLAARQIEAETGLNCALGAPLLGADPALVAHTLAQSLPAGRAKDENVVFMGHGGQHAGVASYMALAEAIAKIETGIFIGVMSGAGELSHILPRLDSERVWLIPLLSSVGQHALRDMAGPEPHSWKSRIEQAGHICLPVLSGLVQAPGICDIWLNHLENALDRLGEDKSCDASEAPDRLPDAAV